MNEGVSTFLPTIQSLAAEKEYATEKWDAVIPLIQQRIHAGDSDTQIAEDFYDAVYLVESEGAPERHGMVTELMGVVAKIRHGLWP